MRELGAATPELLATRFAEHVAAGDTDGILGLYAEDAVVSLADGREAAGTAAIRAAFEAVLAVGADLGVAVGVSPRVVLAGPLAMTSFTGTDGEVRAQVARREQDGTWRWVRDGSTLRGVKPAPDRQPTQVLTADEPLDLPVVA
jgi:ketosteroid isomerase-like protein